MKCGNLMIEMLTAYLTLSHSVRLQKRFIKVNIKNELDLFNQQFPVSTKSLNKIYNYYGMGVPAILGLLYGLPLGRKINEEERYALTYLGALTGIIDDAFDEHTIDIDRVWLYLNNPAGFEPCSNYEQLLQFMGSKVLKFLPPQHIEAFFEDAIQVFKVQEESILQKGMEVQYTALYRVTRVKGGLPFILYRY
ncbi:MAG TPA: hypothetical protein VL947_02295, partial [Cytophagales bacterium]|nr:hypothetical protein [Cytophagales bacterium]